MRNSRTKRASKARGFHAGRISHLGTLAPPHESLMPYCTRRIPPSPYLRVLQPPKMRNSRTNAANSAYPHRPTLLYFPLQGPHLSQYLPVQYYAQHSDASPSLYSLLYSKLSSNGPFRYFSLQLQPLPRYLLVVRTRSRMPRHGLAVSSPASTPLAIR